MTTLNPSYYITWVPNPKRLNGTDPVFQFHETLRIVKLATSCWTDWALAPELTVAGNIHYHGYFKLNEKYKYRWFAKALPKLKYNGFVKLDKANVITEAYMIKDKALMERILNIRLPIRELPLPHRHDQTTEEQDEDLDIAEALPPPSSLVRIYTSHTVEPATAGPSERITPP